MTINYKMEGHRPWERTSYHYLLTMIRMQIWLIVIVIILWMIFITRLGCIQENKVDFEDTKKPCISMHPHPRRVSIHVLQGADEDVYYYPVIPKDTFVYHLYMTRVRTPILRKAPGYFN
eukprot:275290_1